MVQGRGILSAPLEGFMAIIASPPLPLPNVRATDLISLDLWQHSPYYNPQCGSVNNKGTQKGKVKRVNEKLVTFVIVLAFVALLALLIFWSGFILL